MCYALKISSTVVLVIFFLLENMEFEQEVPSWIFILKLKVFYWALLGW